MTQRLTGQLRFHGKAIVGLDMGAALQMAAALGVSTMAVAEFLPAIEAMLVRKLNEQIGEQDD